MGRGAQRYITVIIRYGGYPSLFFHFVQRYTLQLFSVMFLAEDLDKYN